MSKGSHRRKSSQLDAESETVRAHVWLVVPDQESSEQRALRDEVMRECRRYDWTPVIRVARQCRVEGGPDQGRPYLLVEPRDAAELYAVLHRNRVLVLATASCYVRRNPSPNPSRHRDLVGLEGFVRYKASFGIIRGHGDIMRLIERFWPGHLRMHVMVRTILGSCRCTSSTIVTNGRNLIAAKDLIFLQRLSVLEPGERMLMAGRGSRHRLCMAETP